jgi:hypothetical protein
MLVTGTDPGIAHLHRAPQKFEILVGFSGEKRNQFFEHKHAGKPPKNQARRPAAQIVRENGILLANSEISFYYTIKRFLVDETIINHIA